MQFLSSVWAHLPQVNRQRDELERERAAHLQRYLELEDQRAREREGAPERVAIAQELQSLHSELEGCLASLQSIQQEAFGREMDSLRIREMQLLYDLGEPHTKYRLLLNSARAKRWEALKAWKHAALEEKLGRGEGGGAPNEPGNGQGLTPEEEERLLRDVAPPTDKDLGLNLEEREVLALYNRAPRPPAGEEEREGAMAELAQVKREREEVNRDHQRHQQLITRCVVVSAAVRFCAHAQVTDSLVCQPATNPTMYHTHVLK